MDTAYWLMHPNCVPFSLRAYLIVANQVSRLQQTDNVRLTYSLYLITILLAVTSLNAEMPINF